MHEVSSLFPFIDSDANLPTFCFPCILGIKSISFPKRHLQSDNRISFLNRNWTHEESFATSQCMRNAKRKELSREKNGVLWTLPRGLWVHRADMPTADSIAVALDSIPSFKPEPERAYSRTVRRVINGGFALKSFFSSFKAKSSSASNQSPIVWYPFSLSARNRPHRIVRMRILILILIRIFVVFSSQELILFRIPTQCSARLRVREEFVPS